MSHEPEDTPPESPAGHHISIGLAAGEIWEYLKEHGPATQTRLTRELNLPRDLVLQGIGWLAREEKLVFREVRRSRLIELA
ncbi:MAG: winged helix-turn-helix domain-containing protein [Planctomycetaceae bacterium]|nr:winged helix-turn-helix domain-containing protein [Planctomycetaceae bacterium]